MTSITPRRAGHGRRTRAPRSWPSRPIFATSTRYGQLRVPRHHPLRAGRCPSDRAAFVCTARTRPSTPRSTPPTSRATTARPRAPARRSRPSSRRGAPRRDRVCASSSPRAARYARTWSARRLRGRVVGHVKAGDPEPCLVVGLILGGEQVHAHDRDVAVGDALLQHVRAVEDLAVPAPALERGHDAACSSILVMNARTRSSVSSVIAST